jgi:hypothetical protein
MRGKATVAIVEVESLSFTPFEGRQFAATITESLMPDSC